MIEIKQRISEFLGKNQSLLFVGILFILGVLILHRSIQGYKNSLGSPQDLSEILIAQSNLREGQILRKSDVVVSKIPTRYKPVGALIPQDFSKVSGLTIGTSVGRGEMLLWKNFRTEYNHQFPSSKLQKGYRAISIPVTAISSVSNLVQAGDHVDILVTIEIPGESKPSTLVLLQNVTVFSVGMNTDEDSASYSAVTLMVLPSEVAIITHGFKHGDITLSLRHPTDLKTQSELNIVSGEEFIQAAFRNHIQAERDQMPKIKALVK